MVLKYFDNFTGEWLDITGSEGATLQIDSNGEWVVSGGYKKWVGVLKHGPTTPFQYTEFENTLGVTLNYSQLSTGTYSIGYTNIFTLGKTFVLINNFAAGCVNSATLIGNDSIEITTIDLSTLAPADYILAGGTTIEIRVYN